MKHAQVPLKSRKHEVVGAAVVDDADFELVSRYTWRLVKQRHTSYAMATIAGERVYMHRLLLPGADEVDHINHDGLDNQRHNLRPATHQQNALNRAGRGAWKGVTQRSAGCWRAQISFDQVDFRLGSLGNVGQANFPDRVAEYERQCRESCYYPDGSKVVPEI